ncbi:hypothetical protein LJB76_00640 [Clostridia bacterium OttesenSCG-928-O13]|nr:hypothetical protein [Clostridia bacterium OttesenSCG-928-O13]
MKKFFEGVMEWKTAAALLFSGSVILCVVVMLFLGKTEIPIPMLASLLIVSAVGSFIQFLAFGNHIIKNMRYSLRMIVFIVPFFSLLAINALCFQWFPTTAMGGGWLAFTGIFIVVFIGMTIGFEIYFRATGKKYDGLLGQYRKKREQEKE